MSSKVKGKADGAKTPEPMVQLQPYPQAPGGFKRFYNRELSWLQFNRRVLDEAGNKQHPRSNASASFRSRRPISMNSTWFARRDCSACCARA